MSLHRAWKKLSEEHKRNISKSSLKTQKWKFWWEHNCSKKINQYSKDWEFIKTWDSLIDAQKCLWIAQSNVSRCCK